MNANKYILVQFQVSYYTFHSAKERSEIMNNKIGNRIFELRNRQSITQEELALKVGVTRQAISKWERGERLPDLYNIQQLARAFDVTVDDIVGEKTHQRYERTVHSNNVNLQNIGGYFKKLLFKAKHMTNSEEAKKLRKTLLLVGGIGIVVGAAMVLFGFIGFANGAFNSVNDMPSMIPGEMPSFFNPIPYMLLFLLGGVVSSISGYVLYIGIAVVAVSVGTDFLDTRRKCPKCGDEIDADEKSCSNCGYNLQENPDFRCICGKENEPNDKFCRECGAKL